MANIEKIGDKPIRLDKALKQIERTTTVAADQARFAEILRLLDQAYPTNKTSTFDTYTGHLSALILHIMPSLRDPDILTLERQQSALETLEQNYAFDQSNKTARLAVAAIRRELKWLARLRVGINSVIGS
jgi:hypothetical protein